jgi:hypothetical protein
MDDALPLAGRAPDVAGGRIVLVEFAETGTGPATSGTVDAFGFAGKSFVHQLREVCFAESADVVAVPLEAELSFEFVGVEFEIGTVVAGGADERPEMRHAFGRPSFRVIAAGNAQKLPRLLGGEPLSPQVVDLGFPDAKHLLCCRQRQVAVMETADDAFRRLGAEAVLELNLHAGSVARNQGEGRAARPASALRAAPAGTASLPALPSPSLPRSFPSSEQNWTAFSATPLASKR